MAQQLQPEGDVSSGSSMSSIMVKPAHDAVWDSQLFLNKESAQIWACTMCGHIPKKCMADESNKVLCESCAKPLLLNQKIVHAPFADGRIGEIGIKCKNKLFKPSASDDDKNKKEEEKKDEAAAAAATDACDWTGSIKEWQSHNDKECKFTTISCQHCNKYNCSKSLMEDHYKICDEKLIICPQGCDNKILRKNTDKHIANGNTNKNINGCIKTILTCTNNECTEKKERGVYHQHVDNECVKRIVSCSFRQYGCKKPDIKAEELKQHEDESKIEHLQFQVAYLQKTIEDDRGIIKMYTGNVDDIPKRYLLCNGKNGTPDLSAQFIKKENNEKNVDNKQNCFLLCYIVKVS